VPAFQLRVNFRSGVQTLPYGTAIDHWVFTYVSGPTALATTQVPATEQYVNYTNAAAGVYQVSAQAFDASSNPLGTAIAVNFTVPDPIGLAPSQLPVKAYIVGANGANTFTLRFLTQNLTGTGQVLDHTVVTLTGPVNTSLNLAAGQQTLTFGPAPSMLNGDYSYSLQAIDINAANIGPPMTGRLYYFDDTQTTPSPLMPTTPGIVITNPGYPTSAPGL
jgi:hypothetical protein